MSVDTVIYIGQQAMLVALMVSAPMLLAGMIIGLFISVLQSVTQIQEITLTFVPKIIVVMVTFLICMPLMLSIMLNFMEGLIGGFTTYVL